MEVHAHTQTSRKKWTHYLWEFLMLFLAVFCGFLAEYQLEHTVEINREKVYIRSMVEDLQKDTTNFTFVINDFTANEYLLNGVLVEFDSGSLKYSPIWTKNFISSVKFGFEDFYYTDRTLQQLKNSGGLRLIRNKESANGIIEYDASIKDLDFELEGLSRYLDRFIETVEKIWSYRKMFKDQGVENWEQSKNLPVKNLYWNSNDPSDFEYLYNIISAYHDTFTRIKKILIKGRQQANELIILLKKEYHLK